MQGYINNLEDILISSAGLAAHEYEQYIDVDSYIDYLFVYELAHNAETYWPKSVYMHKDRGGKLTAGPVWDFDYLTFKIRTPEFGTKKHLYYGYLFSDPKFKNRVKERWAELKPKFEQIPAFIEELAQKIKLSNSANIAIWPISTNINGDEKMSFEEAVETMKTAYLNKLNWLDTQFAL